MADPAPFWHPAQVTERRIRLRWLTLWRWRAVQPGTRLDFADGINLILGHNGTGKTHLLDLLSVVLRGDLRPLQGEEFDLEWEIEVEGRWHLHLRARHRPSRRRGEAAESSLEHQVERPAGGGPLPPRKERPVDLFDGLLYTSLIWAHRPEEDTAALFEVELFAGCFRLDEHLDLFRAIIARTGAERFTVFSTPYEAARWRRLDGLDVIPYGDLLPFNYTRGILWAETLQARLTHGLSLYHCAVSPRATGGVPAEGLEEFHGVDIHFQPRAKGPAFTQAEALSFGQKRYFTWLYLSLCAPAGPLLADELSNGLHHGLIVECTDEIGDRQAFLATQEPGLLNHIELQSAEATRAALLFCRMDDEGRWIWEKPSPAEAAEVFRAYEVGIQHLSDILLTQGLWCVSPPLSS
jgi:hypothetical protein